MIYIAKLKKKPMFLKVVKETFLFTISQYGSLTYMVYDI